MKWIFVVVGQWNEEEEDGLNLWWDPGEREKESERSDGWDYNIREISNGWGVSFINGIVCNYFIPFLL